MSQNESFVAYPLFRSGNGFDNRLRTLRHSLSLSQAKLAELLGITQSSLNRYENGQSTPTVELFRKYADFFDVSMDYMNYT